MKRLLILCSVIILLSTFGYGQSFTTVTGTTITDGGGQVWSNMTIVANLIPPNGSSLGILKNQGFAITDTPQYVLGDSSGNFSITLDDNTKITPGGSFWRLSVCSNTSSICSTLDIPISGVSMNITSQVQNVIKNPTPNSTTTITRGYNVNEVTGGNGSLFWRTTDNTLWGCQTTPNASCPPGWVQVGAPTNPLPTATATGQQLYAAGPGNVYTANPTGTIDVRFGIGGSGGVDCTGAIDSTTILQTMINNAPDYSSFFFPQACKVKISGSPAITIDQRVGLQFIFAGRNGNGCAASNAQAAMLSYSQAYAAGNRVIYINRSQSLEVRNMTVWTNGGADYAIDIDQVGATPPITTRNDFYNVCIYNSGLRNPSWIGVALARNGINNTDNQHFYHLDVTCSSQSPTSISSNGFGFSIVNSFNPKNTIVDDIRTTNCSIPVAEQNGSDFSMVNGLGSGYVDFFANGFNSLLMGYRSETAVNVVSLGPIGPHLIMHNDFAASAGTIIDGPTGCGNTTMISNEQDTIATKSIDCHGAGGYIVALNNRNFNMLPTEAPSFVVSPYLAGALSQTGSLTNKDTNWISIPLRVTFPTPTATGAPGLMFDTLKSGTYDHFIMQPIIQVGDSDVGLNINYLGNNKGYIGLGGIIPGIHIGANTTTSNSINSISPRGVTGGTTWAYLAQPITISGHGDCSPIVSIPNGNALLNSSNNNVILLNPYAGAIYYNIYRTTSGGTPNTNGFIGKAIGYTGIGHNTGNDDFITFTDNGITGDGTTCPVGDTSGDAQFDRHLTQNTTGNWAGTCTMAAGTSCTVTLTAAFATTPGCVVTVQGGTAIAGACSVSGTTVTVTAASANSATWAAMLFGNPN